MRAAWALLGAAMACAAAAEAPNAQRRTELKALLLNECGACHGRTLRGGLGPPLLPETLAGRSEDELLQTLLNGRSGTPMPPWRPFLSDEEARWVVRGLLAGQFVTMPP